MDGLVPREREIVPESPIDGDVPKSREKTDVGTELKATKDTSTCTRKKNAIPRKK